MVTATNKLYTWGASPQLIRLMNQANKRARLARKFEETKTTITNDLSSENKSNDPNEMANGKKNSTENGCDDVDAKKDINDSPVVTNLEERIKSFLKMKTINKSDVYPVSAEEEAQESTSTDTDSTANTNKKIYADIEEETTEHLIPSQVDTSEIVGEILHVSILFWFLRIIDWLCFSKLKRSQVVYITMHWSQAPLVCIRGEKI